MTLREILDNSEREISALQLASEILGDLDGLLVDPSEDPDPSEAVEE